MLNKIQMLVLMSLSFGCQTADPATRPLSDQSMEVKGNALDGIIGVNAKSKLVIRKTTAAETELASTELANMHLRTKAEQVTYDLDRCRRELSDKRLGGSGKMPPKGIDINALFVNHQTEEMGLDEAGDLQVVKEQEFTAKLASEKKLSAQLIAINDESERNLDLCTNDLADARRSHGLQGKRYQSEGYTTQAGVYVSNHHGEADLDDAFEISAAKSGK